jgi:hypothetical protein
VKVYEWSPALTRSLVRPKNKWEDDAKSHITKAENNKLDGLHQKPDQTEETRCEGQNFSEVVAPQEEKEAVCNYLTVLVVHSWKCNRQA